MIRTFEVRAGGVPFIRTLEDRAILSLSLSLSIYIYIYIQYWSF